VQEIEGIRAANVQNKIADRICVFVRTPPRLFIVQ
jgi:hypothetical protein